MDNFAALVSQPVLDELSLLDAFVSRRHRQSLPELLSAWRRYSDLVASRLPVDMDDFKAMLFARDAIQEAVNRATLSSARLLEALISHEDSAFEMGTTNDENGLLLARRLEHRPGWWWGRIPLVIAPAES
jgi:hypothetical protein